tara:strand:+ start:177 stop:575 length:399 start_codon:yes stop_codon:yes gene_type:complete
MAVRFMFGVATLLGLAGCLSTGPIYEVRQAAGPGKEPDNLLSVSGKHCGSHFLFIPLIFPSASEAVQNALNNLPVELRNANSWKVHRLELDVDTYFILFPWEFVGPFGICINANIEIDPDAQGRASESLNQQ